MRGDLGRWPGPGATGLIALALVALSPACAEEAARAPAGSAAPVSWHVRDSAGVTVVDNLEPAWSPGSGWTVEDEPSLEIGSRSGTDEGTGFGRVGPVVRLSDGRIVVGDLQAMQLFVFGPDGSFLQTWAGPGQGPGELARLDALVAVGGDSIVARNDGPARHEVYGPDGSWVRTVHAPDATFFETRRRDVRAMAWFEDGSFLVGPVVSYADLPPGRQVLQAEWHRFDADGGHQGLFARLPERIIEVRGPEGWPDPVVFGPSAHVHSAGTEIWFGYSADPELRRLGSGGVDRIIRVAWGREAVPESLKRRYQAWYEDVDGRREGDRASMDVVRLLRLRFEREMRGRDEPSIAFADSLPLFTRLVVADDGGIWLEEHATVRELEGGSPARVTTRRWTVVRPDGRWLGSVEMPPGLEVRGIASGQVFGVWLDELDVPYVRFHRILER